MSGKFRKYGAKVTKADKMLATIVRAEKLHDIVNKMFWLEIECAFPELQSKKKSGVRSDWKICWSEPDAEDTANSRFDEEVPEHIKPVLRDLEQHLANARRYHDRHH